MLTRSLIHTILGLQLISLPTLAQQSDALAQVSEGQALYDTNCAGCHHMTLRGSAHGTALKGAAFIDRWGERNSTAPLQPDQYATG